MANLLREKVAPILCLSLWVSTFTRIWPDNLLSCQVFDTFKIFRVRFVPWSIILELCHHVTENGSPVNILKHRNHVVSYPWFCFLKDESDSCVKNGLIGGRIWRRETIEEAIAVAAVRNGVCLAWPGEVAVEGDRKEPIQQLLLRYLRLLATCLSGWAEQVLQEVHPTFSTI